MTTCITRITWGLQLLADGGEGAGAGEGAGTATGVTAGDAALPDRLAELGVPQDKIEKRKKALERRDASMRRTAAPAAAASSEAPKAAEAAPQPETGKQKDAAPAQEAQPGEQTAPAATVTRETMLADPAMKKIMDDYANEIVRNRVKATGQEAESFRTLQPMLDVLAGYYGMDRANLDLAELVDRVARDDNYYEDRAIQEGKSVEEVKNASIQAARQQQIQEQTLRQHFDSLRQQGEALKQRYPTFDLGTELRNPAFARMVGPGSLISLEDAYFSVHRQEILAAQKEAAEKAAMEAASRSIQAGQARPVENGATPTATPASAVNMRDKSYRDDLKRRIYAAAARGEKIYPGA